MDGTYSTPSTGRMAHEFVGKEPWNQWVGVPIEDDQLRALAVGALFARTWSSPHDKLSYAAMRDGGESEKKRNQIIAGLNDWWGVTCEAEAIDTARRLQSGMHAPDYAIIDPLARDAATLTDLDFMSLAERHRDFLSLVAHFTGRNPMVLHRTYDQWTQALKIHKPILPFPIPVSFAGWDLVRSVYIIRGAFTANYLDADTAWAMLFDGLRIAQSQFGNWRQLADSYQVGFTIWNADRDLASTKEASDHRAIQNLALHTMPDSPWRRVALHPGGEVDVP